MPYKFDVFESKKLVKVTYIGDVTLDERLSVVYDLCRLPPKILKNLKVLIDTKSLLKNMTETEQKIFGEFVSTVDELKRASVAVIVNDVVVSNEVAIKISSLKGHKVQRFSSENDAIKWLNI